MSQPSGLDPELTKLIISLVGAITTIGVAFVSKVGSRRTRQTEEVASLVDDLTESLRIARLQLLDANKEIRMLKKELRDCEALRRSEFEASVRQMFPEHKEQ